MNGGSNFVQASGDLQVNDLFSTHSSDTRPTTSLGIFDGNVVGFRSTIDEFDAGFLVVFVEGFLDHIELEGV
jgi:hypothetical protein